MLLERLLARSVRLGVWRCVHARESPKQGVKKEQKWGERGVLRVYFICTHFLSSFGCPFCHLAIVSGDDEARRTCGSADCRVCKQWAFAPCRQRGIGNLGECYRKGRTQRQSTSLQNSTSTSSGLDGRHMAEEKVDCLSMEDSYEGLAHTCRRHPSLIKTPKRPMLIETVSIEQENKPD